MQSSNFTLAAPDGVEIYVYRWLAASPKAIVQIAHGLAEHAGRYARLAETLTAAGFTVYANDHRGHGRTARTPQELGFFAERDGWTKCLDDMLLLTQRIAADHPGLPIVLLGHSMGATLAEGFMGKHDSLLAGVVLSGGNGKPTALAAVGRLIARIERLRLGPRGRSNLLSALTFEAFNKKFAPTRTAFDWLSRDTAEVDKYVADPLCGFPATVQLWIDLLGGWAEVSRASYRAGVRHGVPIKDLPIYVISGSRDPVSGNTRQIELWLADYRAAGHKEVEHRFYADARHELFNETNRDQVTGDLIAWLERVIAR
jgi:alpha-beta hydrolase superfamily lysophospholipase